MPNPDGRSSASACGFTFDLPPGILADYPDGGGFECAEVGDHFCWPRAIKIEAFFAGVLVHTKSRFARLRFVLAAWQRDEIIYPLFGLVIWSAELGRYRRRYTIAWLELARKNGKSELLAGIVLYLLLADGEEGAEIYGAAKDTKQARKVWDVAYNMIRLSPELQGMVRDRLVGVNRASLRIFDVETGSYYEPVTSDAAGELGHNPHGVAFDEVIAQPSAFLWNALRTAMGAREQPLMVAATTAGDDPESFAAEQHAEMVRVLEEPERAPHVFAYIRNTPKDADPWNEANWDYANPALDDFLSRQALRDEAIEARNDPTKENAFRQFRLNQWVQQVTRWMPLHLWDPCGQLVVESQLRGRRAFAGLDLAATTDLAAFVMFLPAVGEPSPANRHLVLWRYWCPEAMVPFYDEHLNGAATLWARDGFLRVTEGDVVDYDELHAAIAEDARTFRIADVGYDPAMATPTVQFLQKLGVNVVPVAQGFGLSPAMGELMRLVKVEHLNHGGSPVSRWNADSIEVRQDDQERVKPVKPKRDKSAKRIDGLVALAMAIDGWQRRGQIQRRPAAMVGVNV